MKSPPPRTPRPKKAGVTFAAARELALALPGVEDGTSYGTPALKASGKLLARLKEDGETLVVRVDLDARDLLLRSDPEAFFLTDHYVAHPWILVRLPAVQRAALATLLEEAHRLVAPTRPARPARPKPPARAAPAAPAVAKKKAPSKAAASPAASLARLRALCLALPEATEVVSHGAPCFKVRDKTFVMFLDNHHGDGRVAIWCKAPPGAQAMMVAADPRRFFVPPYVGPRGWIGVRLDLDPDWGAVSACVEESYQMSAPKRRR
jgi:hypothetical protein